VATVLDSDLAPVRQRTVPGPVGQRPLPRLPPQIPARTTATARHLTVRTRLKRTVPRTLHDPVTAFMTGDLRPAQRGLAAGCGASPDLAHQQLVGSDQRERWTRRYHPPRRRRLRDRHVRGQARHTAHHQQRPRQEPATATRTRVAQQRGRGSHDHPIHRKRRQSRHPARLAMQLDQQVHVQVRDRPRDQRQQRHAPSRGPPDPPVRPAPHRCTPRISSPPNAGMYVRAVSPSSPNPQRVINRPCCQPQI
jgi:hypothetical protein